MNTVIKANSTNSTPFVGNIFKNWIISREDTYDNHISLCKEITKQHFSEMIEHNIQTSMYHLLVDIVGAIDLKYLSDIAKLYKNGNIDDITAQFEEAILDVLIQKRLIKNKKPKNKLII